MLLFEQRDYIVLVVPSLDKKFSFIFFQNGERCKYACDSKKTVGGHSIAPKTTSANAASASP